MDERKRLSNAFQKLVEACRLHAKPGVSYTCSACSGPVSVDGEEITRECGHNDAAVAAGMSATSRGSGAMHGLF